MKLLRMLLSREPVLAATTGIAGGVAALYGVLEAFEVLTLTPKQVAAIGLLAAWGAAFLARRVVTPVAKGQTT